MTDAEVETDDAQDVADAEPVVSTKQHNRQAARFHRSRKGGGAKFMLLGLLLIIGGVLICVGAYYGINAVERVGLYRTAMGLGAVVAALGLVGGLVGLAKNG